MCRDKFVICKKGLMEEDWNDRDKWKKKII
jgi:hypothetical protein